MFDNRTIYKITDERGNPSSITLDKLVADVLQMHLPDVHDWIQGAYNLVAEKKPERGRIQKGDTVRALATRVSEKHPEYHQSISEILSVHL